jgi:hypothetical protein
VHSLVCSKIYLDWAPFELNNKSGQILNYAKDHDKTIMQLQLDVLHFEWDGDVIAQLVESLQTIPYLDQKYC